MEAQLKVQNLVSFVDALTLKCSAAVVPIYRFGGAHLTSSMLRSGCMVRDWYLSTKMALNTSRAGLQRWLQRHISQQASASTSRSRDMIS